MGVLFGICTMEDFQQTSLLAVACYHAHSYAHAIGRAPNKPGASQDRSKLGGTSQDEQSQDQARRSKPLFTSCV